MYFPFFNKVWWNKRKIIAKLKKTEKEKDSRTKILDDIRTKYSNEKIVDLDLQKNQNNHEIELIEEAGKNIGIINFGSKFIKIITDGNIALTKREKTKIR